MMLKHLQKVAEKDLIHLQKSDIFNELIQIMRMMIVDI